MQYDVTADKRFPTHDAILDVTKAPYNAKGDGRTDDTAALQKAITDATGRHKVIDLPNGTYLVSRPLVWTNKIAPDRHAYGFNWVQGQNPLRTVIRLKDDTLTDPKKPAAILWCGGFGSADWFHNYVEDVTFDTGRGNPGAIGLQFYSNNTGAVRNCRIVSQDGQGEIGLDLGHRDMNGPLLVRRGSYAVEKPVTLRGKVRRLLGTGGHVDYTAKSKPDFIVGDGDARAAPELMSRSFCSRAP